MIQEKKGKITFEELTGARNTIDRAIAKQNCIDDFVSSKIQAIKNKVSDEMRQYYRNLFTMAIAQPLVEWDTDGFNKKTYTSISEFIPSRYRLPSKVVSAFQDSGLNLQI